MDNFTKEQINKAMDALPYEIHRVLFTPEIEQKVVKLGFSAGLLVDQLKTANDLVNFAIMNLVPREHFASVAEKELSLTNEVAKELADGISREIFASAEAIEAQAKKEQELYEASEKTAVSAESAGLAPNNLPTDESAESFLPKLTPKIIMPMPETKEKVGLFEEKMGQVFTASKQLESDTQAEPARQNITQQNQSGQSIPQTFTPAAPAPQTPKAPPFSIPGTDPYREPIE